MTISGKKTKEKVVIIIPIHSASPSAYELMSFKQCFDVLGSHPIKIVAPQGVALTNYQAVVNSFETIFIDPKWQANVLKYNKLKTSRFFYKLFRDYQFLLTYELDAFVFKDELLFWCDKNYDYIGAPWFEGYVDAKPDAKLIGVGNSGFSLRKIESASRILRSIYYKNPLEYEGGGYTVAKAYLKSPFRWLLNQAAENYTVQKNFHYHEDVFFSSVAPAYDPSFIVAPIEEAMRFSFEVNPRTLFKLNGDTLPMGCHAWWRYDKPFWEHHIRKFGYVI